MSIGLSNHIRELRKESGLSQSELAKRMTLSEVVIQRWENGSSIPTRQKIIKFGKAINLDKDKLTGLLKLVNYETMSSFEIARYDDKLVGFQGDNQDIERFVTRSLKYMDDTGTSMGVTIENLNQKVNAIVNTIGEIQTIIYSDQNKDDNIPVEFEKRIEPLRHEVLSIKEEVLPIMHQTRDQLKNYESFVRDNADFLKSAVEAQGLLKGLQGQINSMEKRLTKIENQINLSRQRTITIISSVVAIISLILLFYTILFK